MPHDGYHLFVSGPPGSGKKTLARQAIDQHVAIHGVQRSDWVLVLPRAGASARLLAGVRRPLLLVGRRG